MSATDMTAGEYPPETGSAHEAPPRDSVHEAVPTHYDHAHEWGDQPTIKFFPDHFMSEVTAMFLVLALLTALCIFSPAFLDIKADPMATPTGSKPEWYFMFLYAFLHFVPPIVGTFTPMVGVVLLTLLPWLDRNPERAPRKRLVAIIGSTVLLVIIVALTVLGFTE